MSQKVAFSLIMKWYLPVLVIPNLNNFSIFLQQDEELLMTRCVASVAMNEEHGINGL